MMIGKHISEIKSGKMLSKNIVMAASIIIPAYNEYSNLTILIEEINLALEGVIDFEIINHTDSI